MNNIRGLIETSFVDWPGRTCAVIFLGGCNFRCPFCHNHQLATAPDTYAAIPLEELLSRLAPLKKWLGGVAVSGGEPTLDPRLPELLRTLREAGYRLKLDTNGSRPEVLARLLAEQLLEMVALDVKAPLSSDKYSACCGVAVDLELIRRSISLVQESGIAHEFRMTVLPDYHGPAEVEAWAAQLGWSSSLKLQNYNPRTALDPARAGTRGFSPDEFAGLQKMITGIRPELADIKNEQQFSTLLCG